MIVEIGGKPPPETNTFQSLILLDVGFKSLASADFCRQHHSAIYARAFAQDRRSPDIKMERFPIDLAGEFRVDHGFPATGTVGELPSLRVLSEPHCFRGGVLVAYAAVEVKGDDSERACINQAAEHGVGVLEPILGELSVGYLDSELLIGVNELLRAQRRSRSIPRIFEAPIHRIVIAVSMLIESKATLPVAS